jgi:hypothetical protein
MSETFCARYGVFPPSGFRLEHFHIDYCEQFIFPILNQSVYLELQPDSNVNAFCK